MTVGEAGDGLIAAVVEPERAVDAGELEQALHVGVRAADAEPAGCCSSRRRFASTRRLSPVESMNSQSLRSTSTGSVGSASDRFEHLAQSRRGALVELSDDTHREQPRLGFRLNFELLAPSVRDLSRACDEALDSGCRCTGSGKSMKAPIGRFLLPGRAPGGSGDYLGLGLGLLTLAVCVVVDMLPQLGVGGARRDVRRRAVRRGALRRSGRHGGRRRLLRSAPASASPAWNPDTGTSEHVVRIVVIALRQPARGRRRADPSPHRRALGAPRAAQRGRRRRRRLAAAARRPWRG